MSAYKIVAKSNGTFGVQRFGSNEVHGSFDSFAEACAAVGLSQIADQMAVADASQY